MEDFTMQNGVEMIAQMMAIAAITAPKAGGKNFVEVKVVEGEKIKEIGAAMVAYGERRSKKNFDRDGNNVSNSEALVLIGLKDADTLGLDCGACGFATCAELEDQLKTEFEFRGPQCTHRLLDMGIALGSAVKIASMLNVDNRIMYRIGAVAREIGVVDWDVVMGIPLSVSGKNIFFDR
jgi:uncharacterized ferredoxin-like protein